MTLRDCLRSGTDYLRRCGVPEARLDAELLLAHVLGEERLRLRIEADRPLETPASGRYLELLRRRGNQRTPLAYLVGRREFWSRSFQVGPDVLIPRPDTETLVAAALDWAGRLRADGALHVAEIGVGAGAVIGILALELPAARLVGVDRSRAALRVARRNLAELGVGARVRLVQADAAGCLAAPLDLLVSNPPYVPSAELACVMPEVRREPQLALDGGPDGLALARRLVRDAGRLLRPGGVLLLEVGAGQARPVSELLEVSGGCLLEVRRDLAGHERVVVARYEKCRAGVGTEA